MKRQMKNIVVTTASIAMSLASTIPAQACGGRGGSRARVSVSRSYHPVSRVPVYGHYPQPACAQPTIIQSQPVASVQPAPVFNTQPAVGSAPVVANRPVASATAIQNASTQIQTTSQVQPAAQVRPTAQPQPASQTQIASQSTTPSNTNTASAEASALQMLVSIGRKQPVNSSAPAATPATSQIPQFGPATTQPAASHIGNWKVNLPGNQSVELTLNADNSFTWTATKNGKSNSFQGQFRIESGRLTLVRTNDLQQMSGSWAGEGDRFTFKLDGATTGGLAFQRS